MLARDEAEDSSRDVHWHVDMLEAGAVVGSGLRRLGVRCWMASADHADHDHVKRQVGPDTPTAPTAMWVARTPM